jgi:uncharacterized protein YdaU (DUF1376 family)
VTRPTAKQSEKSPAFRFYPDDYLSDDAVEMMSLEEQGAYMRLICHAWKKRPSGYLPNDDQVLAGLSRLGDRWASSKATIMRAFRVTDDGTQLYQKRLVAEAKKQQKWKKNKTDAGKAGADKRWQTHRSAIRLPMPKHAFPSSSSSSSSSSSDQKKQKRSSTTLDYESLYAKYPRHAGKAKGMEICRREITAPEQYELLSRAVDSYAAEARRERKEPKFILLWQTFMSGRWLDYVDNPKTGSGQEVLSLGVSLARRAEAESERKLDELRRADAAALSTARLGREPETQGRAPDPPGRGPSGVEQAGLGDLLARQPVQRPASDREPDAHRGLGSGHGRGHEAGDVGPTSHGPAVALARSRDPPRVSGVLAGEGWPTDALECARA